MSAENASLPPSPSEQPLPATAQQEISPTTLSPLAKEHTSIVSAPSEQQQPPPPPTTRRRRTATKLSPLARESSPYPPSESQQQASLSANRRGITPTKVSFFPKDLNAQALTSFPLPFSSPKAGDEEISDTVQVEFPGTILDTAKVPFTHPFFKRVLSPETVVGTSTENMLFSPPHSRRVGPYEIVEEIVRRPQFYSYKARHVDQDRIYFLKIFMLEEEAIKRIQQGIQTAKRLVHPQIVNYRESGKIDGFFYAASEYIEGETLERKMSQFISVREGAEIISECLKILEYAHNEGVIHGALGPTSIFITPQHQVKITDFAFPLENCKSLGSLSPEEAGYTELYYCAIEKIKNLNDFTPQVDIYSAGALLYHLLTEQLPIRGKTIQQILTQTAFYPHRFLCFHLMEYKTTDFIALIYQALQKHPKERYPNMRMFSNDLENILCFRPIVGIHSHLWFRLKWHQLSFKGLLLFLVSLLFFVGILGYFSKKLQDSSDHLIQMKERLEQQNQYMQDLEQEQKKAIPLLAEAYLEKSHSLETQQQVQLSALFAAYSNQLLPSWQAQKQMAQIFFQKHTPYFRYQPRFQSIFQMALSQEGHLYTGDSFRGIQDWDLSQRKALGSPLPISEAFPYENGALAVTPQGDQFFCVLDKRLIQYSTKDFRPLQVFTHHAPISTFLFLPDSSFCFTGTQQGEIVQWDLQTGNLLYRFSVSTSPLTALAYQEEANVLFIGVQNQIIRLDLSAKKHLQRIPLPQGELSKLSYSPSHRRVFSGGGDGKIYGVDPKTGEVRFTLVGHRGAVSDFVFNESHTLLYSIGSDGKLFRWKLEEDLEATKSPEASYTFLPVQPLYCINYTASCLIVSSKTALHFIQSQELKEIQQVTSFSHRPPLHFAVDTQKELLYMGSAEGSLICWNLLQQRDPLKSYFSPHPNISALSLSPSAQLLLTGDPQGRIALWSPQNIVPQQVIEYHTHPICALLAGDFCFFSSDTLNQLVAWDILETGVAKLKWKAPAATRLALSPSCKELWAGGVDGSLRSYHPETGICQTIWSLGKAPIHWLGFDQQDPFLYVASTSFFYKIQPSSGQILASFSCSESLAHASFDERYVYLATSNGFLLLEKDTLRFFLYLGANQEFTDISYIPQHEILLGASTQQGLQQWPRAVLFDTHWLSKQYWEKETQSYLSGFKVLTLPQVQRK